VSDALLDAAAQNATAQGHVGRLVVADPFAGGGTLALAAALRGHRVYAQDINPWATLGLHTMLRLPSPDRLAAATEQLAEIMRDLLASAYATHLSDGTPATLTHTIRVAVAPCSACGVQASLFPHAIVSFLARKESGRSDALLACPLGHLFLGRADQASLACPQCSRPTDPTASYTRGRQVTCHACKHTESLADRASASPWRWTVAVVERTAPGRRELDLPTPAERAQAADERWARQAASSQDLGRIPEGTETRVLHRHGFTTWAHLYPNRQLAVLNALLNAYGKLRIDRQTRQALQVAIVGAAEMAGHLSRWDRYYLKSYEAMAGHRFNLTTLAAEPNVWGVNRLGRGTVSQRLASLQRASAWMQKRFQRRIVVERPSLTTRRRAMGQHVDVCIVEGNAERILLPARSVDVVLTDPPYHDDVQYGELSLLLRAWAGLDTATLDGEATVQPSHPGRDGSAHRAQLTRIFTEVRRVLRSTGHVILTYANRTPSAWCHLFTALQNSGLRAVGYSVVHSENETDEAKRGVRACTLDLVMDLVIKHDSPFVVHHPSISPSASDEELFLHKVGETFLLVGRLPEDWEQAFRARLRSTRFLRPAESKPASQGQQA
jgi:adenine-specific DNA methylase